MARINISIPDDFLSEIDHYKKIKKVNRSQFLADAAKEYFSIIEDRLASEKRIKAWERLFKTREEIKEFWPEEKIDVVKEIRKMREERMQRIESAVTEEKNGPE